jgi:adenosylcobinamide-GDP ribazoletransferase
MKKEIHIFFTALMFYTRIPCPSWVNHSEEYLNQATKYFPLIGWIVGGFATAVLWLFVWVLPPSVAIILSMMASVVLTGAFHEDGFADVCDGFGGGWTKEQILTIMKDSRVGAYGAIGVVLLLLLKWTLLYEIGLKIKLWEFFWVLLSAHSISRLMAVILIFTQPYSRANDASGKAKPIAKKMMPQHFVVAWIFGTLPMLGMALYQGLFSIFILIPCIAVAFYMATYFRKKIDGYTGDCLGATQQITEVVFYLCFLGMISN